jgi:hypothetical protein
MQFVCVNLMQTLMFSIVFQVGNSQLLAVVRRQYKREFLFLDSKNVVPVLVTLHSSANSESGYSTATRELFVGCVKVPTMAVNKKVCSYTALFQQKE